MGPEVNFSYASHKAVNEYKEAKAVRIILRYFQFLMNFTVCFRTNLLEIIGFGSRIYCLSLDSLNAVSHNHIDK